MWRIIIVDDEDSMLDGLRGMVDWTAMGYELSGVFRDSRKALDYLRERGADVVLTDIRMPHVTGLDIARFVCENGLRAQVIVLSGYRDFEYAQQALQYGVRHYITKPFLLATLRSALSSIANELNKNPSSAVAEVWDRPAEAATSLNRQNKTIRQICLYLKENYNADITLSDVARHVNLNPTYLSRLFHQQTGMTYTQYLSVIRVRAAAGLLTSTQLTVYEICAKIGYKSVKHFYKLFKRIMKATPSEYRRGIAEKSMAR